MSIEIWLRFEPQFLPAGLAIKFLFINVRAERKVRLCVKLFDFFPRWRLIRLTLNLSRFVPNSVEVLTLNFRKKNYFRRIFHKFCANQGYPLPKLVKFSLTFCKKKIVFVLRVKKYDRDQVREDFTNGGRGHPPKHLKFFLLVFSKIKKELK